MLFTSMVIFGILLVLSALGVVISRKPLNSALWLVFSLFLVGIHFALMGADFVAVIQVLVYAGAIMVLVVFVIMLLGSAQHDEKKYVFKFSVFISCFIALFFFFPLSIFLFQLEKPLVDNLFWFSIGTTEQIGQAVFTTYLLPFQIIGLLLLAALIGAVALVQEKKLRIEPGRGLQAMQQKSKGDF